MGGGSLSGYPSNVSVDRMRKYKLHVLGGPSLFESGPHEFPSGIDVCDVDCASTCSDTAQGHDWVSTWNQENLCRQHRRMEDAYAEQTGGYDADAISSRSRNHRPTLPSPANPCQRQEFSTLPFGTGVSVELLPPPSIGGSCHNE